MDFFHFVLGLADFHVGRLDRAIDCFRRAIEINPGLETAYFHVAAAEALSGRNAEAAEACAAGLQLAPSFTIAKYRARPRSDNPVYLAGRERLMEGMRKAGLPQ